MKNIAITKIGKHNSTKIHFAKYQCETNTKEIFCSFFQVVYCVGFWTCEFFDGKNIANKMNKKI